MIILLRKKKKITKYIDECINFRPHKKNDKYVHILLVNLIISLKKAFKFKWSIELISRFINDFRHVRVYLSLQINVVVKSFVNFNIPYASRLKYDYSNGRQQMSCFLLNFLIINCVI